VPARGTTFLRRTSSSKSRRKALVGGRRTDAGTEIAGKFLATGADSGLGRFLGEALSIYSITRDTSEAEFTKLGRMTWSGILHCAFNNKRPLFDGDLYGYYADNIELTRRLMSYRCRKFIYVSSVDVYPEEEYTGENIAIAMDSVKGIYAFTKLINEAMIRKEHKNHLILRASAMLGPYSKDNSLIRIARERRSKLTLSGSSTFNYVLHADVLAFIHRALKLDLSGTFNIAASDNICLKDVAGLMGRQVRFGSHVYRTNRIENSKAAAVCDVFKNTSRDNIARFLREQGA